MRANCPGRVAYLNIGKRCHLLTRTISPSGGDGDQGSRTCPSTQENLPKTTPVGPRKQAKGGMYACL
jgi:hypothetical protein